MGCNQSTERKQETTQVAADPQPQQVEEKREAVEASAKHDQPTIADVIVASPAREAPASPSKIDASNADLEPSLDHVAAEGPSEVHSRMPTPRSRMQTPRSGMQTPREQVETAVEPVQVIDVVEVTETNAAVEAEAPAETIVPTGTAAASSVQTQAAAVVAAPVAEPVSETVPATTAPEAKEEARSPVAVPVLAIPAAPAAPAAKKAAKRSKTPVRTAAAASKTPSKSPSKSPAKRVAESKTPDQKGAARKVQFDKVPAQNPQEQRKLRARKEAGRNQGNVNEEMFLASVAAFERQLTHRGNLNKQLGTR